MVRRWNARPLLERLARALAARRLDAVLVGNAAAALQGAPVTTLDFDVMFRKTDASLRKLRAVARDLRAVILTPFYPASELFPGQRGQWAPGRLQAQARRNPVVRGTARPGGAGAHRARHAARRRSARRHPQQASRRPGARPGRAPGAQDILRQRPARSATAPRTVAHPSTATPLIGRERELAKIEMWLAESWAGAGSVVAIGVGEQDRSAPATGVGGQLGQ